MSYGPASRNFLDQITYWAMLTTHNDHGESDFASPVLLRGTWQIHTETVQRADGSEFVSKAVIYLPLPVASDGYLALGDYTNQASPFDATDALEIQAYMELPDLRHMDTLRKAFL